MSGSARRARGYANNRDLGSAGATANARRAAAAGSRQASRAEVALAVLGAAGIPADDVRIAALQLRVAQPLATLAELGAAMPQPVGKNEYAGLLRRALDSAERIAAGQVRPVGGSRLDSEKLRAALLEQLAPGRAITTSELLIRVRDSGFGEVTNEAVYRQLVLLAGRGLVRRIRPRGGGRHVFWALCGSRAAKGEL
ncbi:helix-turn-helix domain-containing protein [Mycobacterium sp. DBP42]|uniref:helix-turn-helix domain-containing protein n=1 Tax=Mycobacteriaceae TaxID=1762 RepID=UPI00110CE0D7|nr:helix-turn-helix domain-containing protein [Mycobacterium sp. DBP42]TMS46970.1 hypothetical protein E0T84_29355 [Mycobacterium sp. DBP42]